MNNLGQVVGAVSLPGNAGFNDVHPFLWDAANGLRLLPDLGRNNGNSLNAQATGINDAGTIVGQTYQEGSRSFLGLRWSDPNVFPVELPCGQATRPECWAVWINGPGKVFGFEEGDEDQSMQHIWEDGEPFLFSDLYVNPTTMCTFISVSDADEVAGGCRLFDTETGDLLFGPAIIVPVVSPELTVTSPTPGQAVPAGQVMVQGVATDDEQVISVTINGIDAVLTSTGNPNDPTEVAFNVTLLFEPGNQTIAATAIDNDGNASDLSFQIDVQSQTLMCDANGDNIVDRADIGLIFAARGTLANGPDDPRDANGDGYITINDGRLCVFECTHANCASNP